MRYAGDQEVTQGLSAAGTAQLNVVAGPSEQQDSGTQRTNGPADEAYPQTKKAPQPDFNFSSAYSDSSIMRSSN